MNLFLRKKINFLNFKLDPLKLYLLVGFFVFPFLSIIFNDLLIVIFLILFFFLFGFVFFNTNIHNYTFYTVFPLIISIFQNILLGICSPFLSSNKVSLLLSFGLLYAFCYIIILFLKVNHHVSILKKLLTLLIILLIYGLFISILTRFDIGGFLSSFRNLSCPIIYLCIGILSFRYTNIKLFTKYISILFWIVFIFGIYEVFLDNNVWVQFNISSLWEKKGIPLYGSLVPVNFYSSEIIFGSQIRRMSSLFADPVNLGTFFGFTSILFFYEKKKISFILSILGILLTVSKGGLLTILILFVFSCYSKRNKKTFFIALIVAGLLGLAFVVYSFLNSTQSIVAHLNGFFGSFSYMIQKPLGAGIGNVGTLSAVVTGFTNETTAIFESGFGMILGQLGFFGLCLYAYYFYIVFNKCAHLNSILLLKMSLTLLFSITANILFNEVALSPNSSAIYFIFLGFLIFNKYFKKEIL